MGQSIETQVEFVSLDRHDVEYWMLHEGKRYEEHTQYSEITHKARKKIADAQPGDIIEVVWDYDADLYPIVEARRITGSPEETVRLLTEQVAELEKVLFEIPHIMRQASDAVRGDRYEESRRVIHSVALAIENSFPKREV